MAVKLLLRPVVRGIYHRRCDVRLSVFSGQKCVFIQIYRSHGRVIPRKMIRMFWRNIPFVRILVLNTHKPRTVLNRLWRTHKFGVSKRYTEEKTFSQRFRGPELAVWTPRTMGMFWAEHESNQSSHFQSPLRVRGTRTWSIPNLSLLWPWWRDQHA